LLRETKPVQGRVLILEVTVGGSWCGNYTLIYINAGKAVLWQQPVVVLRAMQRLDKQVTGGKGELHYYRPVSKD
jgi:hypothetical protein